MALQQLNSSHRQWPASLSRLSDPPNNLYHKGSVSTDVIKVAIVGSRRPSRYGQIATNQIAHQLASAGVEIVSGLALGVDSIAHRACLEAGGRTMAILAHGLDQIYPRKHTQLANDIVKAQGSLVSEYPLGTPPLKHHFIARNRLIAAMADALVVTEANERSGTTSTANFALELGKEVMAVPGNITSQLSKGTNRLIQNGAQPVLAASDILHALDISSMSAKSVNKALPSEHQHIIDLVQKGVHDGNELMNKSTLSSVDFATAMTQLEIAGIITAIGHNQWCLKAV